MLAHLLGSARASYEVLLFDISTHIHLRMQTSRDSPAGFHALFVVRESAGINRLGIENERVLRRTTSH